MLPEETTPFIDGYASLTPQYEAGNIGTVDYLHSLHLIFNKKFAINRLERAFSRMIGQPIAGMSGIVSRVANNRQTALVSNTNEIHYKLSLAKLETLDILHKHYISYQLRALKPAAVIKDQGFIPSELLCIDDRGGNCRDANNSFSRYRPVANRFAMSQDTLIPIIVKCYSGRYSLTKSIKKLWIGFRSNCFFRIK